MRMRGPANGRPDVTLVNLNLYLARVSGHLNRQCYVPLGLLYIAAVLEEAGYEVELIDYQLFSQAELFDAEMFVRSVGDTGMLVGISCMSNLLPFAILCAQRFKERQPGCRTVLGGVGPSPVAREIVDTFPFVDAVAVGEGELTALELARGDLSRLHPPRPVTDLDILPLPAYSLLNLDLYDASPSIITSRGCPYSCAFCTEPYNFGGSVRFRSVESVMAEIELVHERSGKTLFLFQDDILPLDRSRFRRVLRAFRENLSFPITWKCFARVDLVDEGLMEEMAASGCVQVRYGIESGSNLTLARVKKGFSIETAYRTVVKSVKYFPSVHTSFIWGYPFEDLVEFKATMDSVSKFEEAGATVLLFQFSPLAGSQIYREFRGSMNASYSANGYSSFVVTGYEENGLDGQCIGPEQKALHELIASHPSIFPGFYEYDGIGIREKRDLVAEFAVRKPLRNEYDL